MVPPVAHFWNLPPYPRAYSSKQAAETCCEALSETDDCGHLGCPRIWPGILVETMRPGQLARSLSKRASLARGLPSILAAQPVVRARRVELVCASCGRVAAHVDEDPVGRFFHNYPDLRLVVRSRKMTRRHLKSVTCPEHGRLKATWKAVLPAAAAARDGQVRSQRLWPVSPAA
jgi:hypothetical protein